MGFSSKKLLKGTADSAFQYRYELTLFESFINEAEKFKSTKRVKAGR